ncbi:MAG TPA: hypothetical protein VFS94_07890 [Gemmatimonadales bacterium]|nr:hypothetical protein [Gemmatimonadales bacterium]
MLRSKLPDVVVGIPAAEWTGSAWRITARVDDVDVWFESEELELTPAPEALVSAFLIPSLAAGRRLVSQAPLAEDFVSHLPAVMAMVHRWWNYPVLQPQVPAVAAPVRERSPAETALCFSGGVDSFHSLLRGSHKPNLLVLVQGFDVRLTDAGRITQMREMTGQVAEAVGAGSAVVRTNLRQHPLFQSERWGRDHGGALAAIGHVLPASVGRLVISSSYARTLARPWGSHWDLDPLWSGAGLEVEHYGEEFLRAAKIAAIAREPLARAHLRVCWCQPNELPNCSRCIKCVRTRILLSAVGGLEGFALLEGDDTLAAAIDALPPFRHAHALHQYRAALEGRVPPDVAAALRRLLARTRGHVLLERLGLLDPVLRVNRKLQHAAAQIRRSAALSAEP